MSKKRKFEQNRTFCRVIHRPTYCYLQSIDPITDKPQYYERHQVATFRKKSDIQSTQSQKRLSNAINWMLMFADMKRIYSKQPIITKSGKEQHHFSFRLAFITLTLSAEQMHSDNYIKEHIFQPFLYWITRYYKASYVWKAEAQLNGNIHFHLTIDTFIHWRSVRAKWNKLLAKHGYCKVFQDGTNDKGNAATQIKAVRNDKQVAKYLSGYLSKKNQWTEKKFSHKLTRTDKEKCNVFSIHCFSPQEKNAPKYLRFIRGRLWGCSESLSKINCFTDQMEQHNFAEVERDFFHSNNLRRLSTILEDEFIKKNPEADRIEVGKKFWNYRTVFIHRHLRWCKLPQVISEKLAEEKARRNFNPQTYFTVESLN